MISYSKANPPYFNCQHDLLIINTFDERPVFLDENGIPDSCNTLKTDFSDGILTSD